MRRRDLSLERVPDLQTNRCQGGHEASGRRASHGRDRMTEPLDPLPQCAGQLVLRTRTRSLALIAERLLLPRFLLEPTTCVFSLALLLGVLLPEPFASAFVFYGLGCVVVAGLWGGFTASRRILYVQALPAALAA